MRFPTLRPLFAATLATLALAGCSGDPQPATIPTAAPDPMPLDPYVAILNGSATYDAEKELVQAVAVEEQIGICMQEQGFSYFPETYTLDDFAPETDEQPEWDRFAITPEIAAEYGYGMIHRPDADEPREETNDPGNPDKDSEMAAKEAAYWESLSETETEAYYLALMGENGEAMVLDENGEETNVWDWTQAGCQGRAAHEVRGEAATADTDPAFQDLANAIIEAKPSPDNDEGSAALEGEWSACMNEAGYRFGTRHEAVYSMESQVSQLSTAQEGEEAPDPTPEQIEAVFQEEVRVAVADATCVEKTDYHRRQLDLTRAFEQRFVDDHRKELDAMVLMYGG